MRPRSHNGCDMNEDCGASPFSLDANINANTSPIKKKTVCFQIEMKTQYSCGVVVRLILFLFCAIVVFIVQISKGRVSNTGA